MGRYSGFLNKCWHSGPGNSVGGCPIQHRSLAALVPDYEVPTAYSSSTVTTVIISRHCQLSPGKDFPTPTPVYRSSLVRLPLDMHFSVHLLWSVKRSAISGSLLKTPSIGECFGQQASFSQLIWPKLGTGEGNDIKSHTWNFKSGPDHSLFIAPDEERWGGRYSQPRGRCFSWSLMTVMN